MEFHIMAIKKSSGSGIPFGNNAGRPANPGYGQLYSNGEAARLELYTQASGWQNIVQETPGVSSITGSYLESTNSGTITISGTNFVSGCYATAIGTNGVQVDATSTTFNSLVQVTATFTGLSNTHEPYDIKVTNPSNLFGMLPDALYINANPIWSTASGTLGTFEEQVAVSVSATATDESTITYSVTLGSLPTGVTLNSNSGLISGTLPNIASNTTYNFTITASDGSNSVPRAFSITSTANLAPVWTTPTGTLATIANASRNTFSYSLAATDAENNTLTYALVSGSLPPNMTVSSSGVISGTTTEVATDTTYSFVLSVSDRINTVTRSFSLIVAAPIVTSITSSSTWTAPAGVSSIKLLMVGAGGGGGNNRGNGSGGGGGGGGIVYAPSAAVTPGQGYAIVIGSGGGGGVANNQSGGPGCVTTGFGATVGGGGGGVSEYSNNCNQGSTCSYLPSTTISGPTASATIRYDAGSGGCSFGAGGSGSTYTTSLSGTSYTYGGVNGGPTVYGSGGVISNSSGGNGIVIISY
jgi:hypothetical protein